MGRLLTKLMVEDLGDGKWRLTAPLRFWSETLGHVVTVPAGFVTDFESIPRVPVIYLLLAMSSNEAGVIHDYLYRADCKPRVTRAQADAVLYEVSRCDGCGLLSSWAKWAGVRVGGFAAFQKKLIGGK
jgi:hypothetical protein